jgi:cobalt-zinc-cadmium efflux system outer membrane protein
MLLVRVHAAMACMFVAIAPIDVDAQSLASSLSGDLTLEEVIRATLSNNPDLRLFEFDLRVDDARRAVARQRPSLELRAEVENVAGTGERRGLHSAEATLSLASVIELGDKRAARIALADVSGDGTLVNRQAAQLDRLAEVTRRFIHVASDQNQLALTQEALRLAEQTVEAVQRRVNAAKSPDVELHRAKIERIRAEVELEHAEHELLSSRVKLAAMWGETEPRFSSVKGELYTLPNPREFDALATDLQSNPDFLRFATLARLRDAELRVAHAQRRGDLTVSAGVRRLESADDEAFVIGFSLPFGTRSRAAPAIAEAHARAEEVEVQRTSAFINARAQLFEIYQELKHAITEARTLSDRVLPQMQGALNDTQYAYERGRYSYIEFVEAQRSYIEVQRSLIEAAANAHTFQAELERLTASPLEQANVENQP